MCNLLVICATLMIFLDANSQMTKYASRFRNFTMESETDSIHLVKMKIFNDKNEHKIACTVNVTKDIHIKNIEVVLFRCWWEKSECEYFQTWRFNKRLKSIVYMKNQIWSPIFDHVIPKPDIPYLKKNIYQTPNATLDTKAVMLFFPDGMKEFWRGDIILNDYNNKKASVWKLEWSMFTFVERSRKRDRGNTHKSTPKTIEMM